MTARIDLIAGARPNFVKLAPVHRALSRKDELECRIVHTGQHYDDRMSQSFLDDLGIPDPHVHLHVGSGTHGVQTARILERYEELLLIDPPAATVVFGDVNSTVACALAAAKLPIPVVHVEAGLRSFDRTMPEEINRVVTDSISDLLLVSEESGLQNLAREGIPEEKIRLIGNVMIDSLKAMLPDARKAEVLAGFGLGAGDYALLTMHRPSNVDDPEVLRSLLTAFRHLSRRIPVVFPVHPRTRSAAERADIGGLLEPVAGRFVTCPPTPYVENLALIAGARVVLTDSGGIQEETSALGVPCLTLRDNTERPATVDLGTNRLVGNDPDVVVAALEQALGGATAVARAPIPLWDGHAGERAADAIHAWMIGESGPH